MRSHIRSFRISLLVIVVGMLCMPTASHAAGVSFPADLRYGMHSASVGQLQDFLRAAGYFTDDTSDTFLSETRTAVEAWQAANCIPATGYFGVLSRQAAAMGSFCVSISKDASSTPESAPPGISVTATSSPIVVVNGTYYVRTTRGLVQIHGGAPRITPHGTVSTPAPTPTYLLSISKTGSSGSGTVTSSPGGIMCGATCSASYSSGASVTLTAVPDGSSSFFGWSGGGCSGTGACTVTINADTTVNAIFLLNLFTPPPDLQDS